MLWNWLIDQIPWWVQMIILAAVVGLPTLLVAFMIWGPKAVLRAVLPVLGVILTLGLASRFRQQGYRDRTDQELEAKRKADAVVVDKRDEAKRAPESVLNQKVDKWSRD